MGELWLIRHGQASFGSKDYDQLSEKGYRQAEMIGRYFKRSGIRFDGYFSGSLKRQIETAITAINTGDMKTGPDQPLILDEFNEYDFMKIIKTQLPAMVEEDPSMAEPAGKIFDDEDIFVRLFSIIFQRWLSGTRDKPGVETFKDYQERILKGINTAIDLTGQDRSIAVFTSGGVIATLLQIILGLSRPTTMETGWQICNASFTRFCYTGEKLVLSAFNTTSHLDMDGDQDLITLR